MKHVVCTILFAMLAIHVFSQEVDEKTARIVAEHFFLKNYGTKASVENVHVKQYKGHESLFYCNMDKGGWVAIPANRNLNPVVAHSDEGSVDLNNAPQVFLDWMEQYEFVVDVAMQEKWDKEDRRKKWDELLAEDFDEQNVLKSYVNHTILISSRWGQSRTNDNTYHCPGYNVLMSNNGCDTCEGHVKAGCVAVAVGQIMNYWGYSTGSYSNFDWWDMPNYLYASDNSNFYKESHAISYLFKRIGARVSMDYDCEESDANMSNADYALEKFGYKDNMSRKLKATHTYNAWVNILKTEILAERPLLYSAGDHVFVCDGYDSDNDNFHFNLGWIGGHNGWYDFEDLGDIPGHSEYGYVIIHSCFVGIQPNVSANVSLSNITIQTTSSDTQTTNKTYQAKNCITVAGNNTTALILDSSSCRFIAGDSIVLRPGFHAQAGTSLLCKIFKRPALKSSDISELDDFSIITYSDEDSFINNTSVTFDVYPNPAKNEITIDLKNMTENSLSLIQIYNSNGIQVYEQSANNSIITVDVSTFPIGQYIINVKSNSKIYCKSFIKF